MRRDMCASRERVACNHAHTHKTELFHCSAQCLVIREWNYSSLFNMCIKVVFFVYQYKAETWL